MCFSFQMKNVHDWCAVRKIAHFYTPGREETSFSGIRVFDAKPHAGFAVLSDTPGNSQFRSVLTCGKDRLYFLDLPVEEAARVLQRMCEHFTSLERALKEVSLARRPLADLLNADGCALPFPVFIICNGEVLAATQKYRTRIRTLFLHFLQEKSDPAQTARLDASAGQSAADGVPYLTPSPIDPGEQMVLAHFQVGRTTLWLVALENGSPLTSEQVLQLQILVSAIRYHLKIAEPNRLKTRILIPESLWQRSDGTTCFSVSRIEPVTCEPSLLLHCVYRELMKKRPDDFVYFSGNGLVLLSSAADPSDLPDAGFFRGALPSGAFLVGKSNLFFSPQDFPEMLQQASQMAASARAQSLPYLAVPDIRGKLIREDLMADAALQCHIHPAVRMLVLIDRKQQVSFPCFETVRALIFHGGNSCAAAKELGINRNTLVQRIARLEDVTGISFSDPRLQESLYLSFLLYRTPDETEKASV